MKRYKNNLVQGLFLFLWVTFVTTISVKYIRKLPRVYTHTQEYTQLSQQIAGMQQSIEMQISEQGLLDCEKYTGGEMWTVSQCEEIRKNK